MRVLLGTQFYDAKGDAARRQSNCAASLLALRDADLVNVQWRDGAYEHAGVETLAVLARDAASVVGIAGRHKPIVVDLFDALADAARRRGLRQFAFVNADILVAQAAIDRIGGSALETLAFSRADLDPTSGQVVRTELAGIDLFAFDVDWWRRQRQRFRPYVLAEWCYDNVFAAIMMAHGRGAIENRAGEIRHEQHPPQPASGAYARYNFFLAALDAPYFDLWAKYVHTLETMRKAGASEADERAMAARMFVLKRSPLSAAWHAGRCARARWRYARDRARFIATAGGALR